MELGFGWRTRVTDTCMLQELDGSHHFDGTQETAEPPGQRAEFIDDMAALERREQALEARRHERDVASAALPRYVYRPPRR
mgnify:CR=1 FL=1